MTPAPASSSSTQISAIDWAVANEAALNVSVLTEDRFNNMRSQLVGQDNAKGLLQILYPISNDHQTPPEFTVGTELGISFRRGHKKCLFVSCVMTRQSATLPDGRTVDTLVVKTPGEIREMQRRLYQRVTVPDDRLVPCKLWQGECHRGVGWPVCAGRVSNISLGGVLLDIRAVHNPRLTVGEVVGVEFTVQTNATPLVATGQYRHCSLLGTDRLGIGVQFIGLEKETSGRATLTQIAEFIRELRKPSSYSHPAPYAE
ncbi:MAG: PilZ domain-containing protein [Planctomycetes bacterium]|nr:PilZ domain-containing protein [Planctomycetota bacterium]